MISSKPLQYIKGWIEFYKLRFKVDERVLIPRPETELLVDEVLKLYTLDPKPYTLIDIGTGTGNIAISLTKNLPHLSHPRGVTILATDISEQALKVARQNAKFHGVEKRIRFLQSNLLSSVIPSKEGIQLKSSSNKLLDPRLRGDDRKVTLDIIVTNLPYIPSARIPYLDPSVKDFEPHLALDGGEDGFELYRKLFKQIKEGSFHPILIIGEIDYTHGQLAVYEAQKYFPEAKIEVKKDLRSKQRILLIRRFGNRSIQV